jgi:hypothetical protein
VTVRELDQRQDGPTFVGLYWDDQTGCVLLSVAEGEAAPRTAVVDRRRARDAFDHPWLYLEPTPKERSAVAD